MKRLGLALEDTKFVTVHHNPDDGQDLEIIEAAHIEPEELNLPYAAQDLLEGDHP